MVFYKLELYVPIEAAEKVKTAIFDAGAGKIGDYDCCCWQTSGVGQFRPLAGSSPYLGSQGRMEHVDELKLELVCPADKIAAVIAAMRAAHPYETPAFHYFEVNTE